MKRLFLCSVLCALATTCLPGAVHAAGSLRMDAGFRNVQLGVMDLTPDDGVAAGFSVQGSTIFHELVLEVRAPEYYYSYSKETGDGSIPSAFESGRNGGFARSQANGTIGGIGVATYVGREHGTWSEAEAYISQGITVNLAPNSVLTFSGEFYLSGAFGDTADTSYRSTYDEFVTVLSTGTEWSRETTWGTATAGESVSPFWFALANSGDTEQLVHLGLGTRVNTRVNAYEPPVLAPVPEPSTWTMLLAGLGMAGFAARRRARARHG